MGFFDLFIKPDLDSLRKQGGMEKKYSLLFTNLKSLSEDYGETYHLIRHQLKSELIKENHYLIKILFVRPEFVIQYLDEFELIHSNENIIIEFNRKTKHNLPFGPKLLPDTIKEKRVFSNDLDQNFIFKKTLEFLTKLFSEKYNYSDELYKTKLNEL